MRGPWPSLGSGAKAVRADATDCEWVYVGQAEFDVLRQGPRAFTGKLQEIDNANHTLSITYCSRF